MDRLEHQAHMSKLFDMITPKNTEPYGVHPKNITDPFTELEYLENPSPWLKYRYMPVILTHYFASVSQLLKEMKKIEDAVEDPYPGDWSHEVSLYEDLEEIHSIILDHPALDQYVAMSIRDTPRLARQMGILGRKRYVVMSLIYPRHFYSTRHQILHARYVYCMLVLISMEPFSDGELKDPGYLKKSMWTKKQEGGHSESSLMSADVWENLTRILGRTSDAEDAEDSGDAEDE